jgi:hypothetical protein
MTELDLQVYRRGGSFGDAGRTGVIEPVDTLSFPLISLTSSLGVN